VSGTLFDVEDGPGFDWDAYDRRISAANAERAKREGFPKPKSDDYWSEQAEWWLGYLVYRGDVITADDLIREVGLPTGSGNQVGARFRKWHAQGVLEPVGYTPSTRPEGHGRAVRQWRKV
jgi:hypothetical protein